MKKYQKITQVGTLLAGAFLTFVIYYHSQTKVDVAVAAEAATKLSLVEGLDKDCAPNDVALMSDGALLIADGYHKNLQKLSEGELTVFAGADSVKNIYGVPDGGYRDGSTTEALFKEPLSISAFRDGWAVTDADNESVRLVRDGDVRTLNAAKSFKTSETDGPTSTLQAIDWKHPVGLATDEKGRLYVSDASKGKVYRISKKGRAKTVASGLKRPTALCIAGNSLLIAQTGANKISKLDLSVKKAKVQLVAGSGKEGLADGKASDARFSSPQGIAAAADGSIYVADTANGALRKIQNEEVTTLISSNGKALSSEIVSPKGLLISGQTLYICDGFSHRLYTINLDK